MERYIGTKIVLAEPMNKLTAWDVGLVRDGQVSLTEPGYKVVYEDGYTSWSPKETFERAYRRITEAEIRLVESGHAGA